MSATKVYTSSLGPTETEHGVIYPVYESSAACILTASQVNAIEIMLEMVIEDSAEEDGESVHEDQINVVLQEIRAGENLMQKLHLVLGAFDADGVGKLTKADSARLDWSKLKAKNKEAVGRKIRLVK